MKLTLEVFEAGRNEEISCPELRLSMISDGQQVSMRDLERFYNKMVAKCYSIVEAGENFPIKDVIPFARLFKENKETIKENILQRNKTLVCID